MILTARIDRQHAGLRLDDAAKTLFPQLSKTRMRQIIDLGGCAVNQVMVRVASREMLEGDEIIVGVMEPERFVDFRLHANAILYEDRDYLAFCKPAGINSQRTPYQLKGTAEYAVARYLKEQGLNEPARVIHRLDRGTSGTMIFPKNKPAATHIAAELKAGQVDKVYWAVVADQPEEAQWTIDAPIGKLNKFRYGVTLPGKPAVTTFRVIGTAGNHTLVEAHPLTGRTHQIRVHLAHSGLPIVGDLPYGGLPAERMLLHCRSMSFRAKNGTPVSATSPVDETFSRLAAAYGLTLPL